MPVIWTEEDWKLEKAAVLRHFGGVISGFLVATDREWAGTDKGIIITDTRVHIKNNGQYHGLETYAWQYLALEWYDYARDYFYMAASMRREDLKLIGVRDPGHLRAEAACLKMAQFSHACTESVLNFYQPEGFGLEAPWIQVRVDRAQQRLDVEEARILSDLDRP